MAISAVDFGTGSDPGADGLPMTVKRWSEILRLLSKCVEGVLASGEAIDSGEAIVSVLVELGGYDCVVLWRVDGSLLIPVSAASSEGGVSTGALVGLASNPPRLEESGLRVAVPDSDLAVTGDFGSAGPMESVLGQHSYAVAGVKHGDDRAFLLQAIYREQRADQVDRDLLMSFAQLFAALASPGATELLTRCRGWALAGSEEVSDDYAPSSDASVASTPPVDDPIPAGLAKLTRREREVLGYAMTGATYLEIAEALFVSVATIHSHMRSVLGKLGLHSRTQLIARYASAPIERPGVDVGDAAAHGGAPSTEAAGRVDCRPPRAGDSGGPPHTPVVGQGRCGHCTEG